MSQHLLPVKKLKLLDLSQILHEETTEFESLDLAIHFLFLSRENSYRTTRYIADKVRKANFDGLIYPSYFSLLRTGGARFETSMGFSTRRLKKFQDYEQQKIVPNVALFGRPVSEGSVRVQCINRIFLEKIEYNIHFGPVVSTPS